MNVEINNTDCIENKLLNKYKDEECSICLNNLENEVSILTCGHYFHYTCLGQWIYKCKNDNKQIICPLCKQEFEIKNIIFQLDTKKYTYKNYSEFKKKYDKKYAQKNTNKKCVIL